MKHFKLLMILFIGVAISTAYSCKKDDPNDDNTGGGTNPSTCYIKKEANENGSYRAITYNSSNKVVKAEEFDSLGKSDSYTMFIYANDEVSEMQIFESGAMVGKYVYTYDAQGKVKKSELYEDKSGTMTKLGFFEFTFTGDDLTTQSMFFEIAGQMMNVSKSEFMYSNGNIVSQKDYSFDMPTLQLKLSNTIVFDYDGKKNPYHGVGIDNLMGDPQFISKENITKKTVKDETGSQMDDESFNATYVYNSNGYPTKRTEVAFDNSKTEVITMEYNCK